MTDMNYNENLVRRIVRSIDKAVTDDIPQYLREHRLETNNAIIHLRGDYINENLRNFAISDEIELIPFTRYIWQGRLLVDRQNKITYSITTQNALKGIPKKKDRTRPHFLQSILAQENSKYESAFAQLTLLPMETFDTATLEEDYKGIVAGLVDPKEGYRHYVISYEAAHNELLDVKLEVLDPNFFVVHQKSLNEFIKPDFARLTNTADNDINSTASHSENVRGLLGIKAGIRPALREVEKQA